MYDHVCQHYDIQKLPSCTEDRWNSCIEFTTYSLKTNNEQKHLHTSTLNVWDLIRHNGLWHQLSTLVWPRFTLLNSSVHSTPGPSTLVLHFLRSISHFWMSKPVKPTHSTPETWVGKNMIFLQFQFITSSYIKSSV